MWNQPQPRTSCWTTTTRCSWTRSDQCWSYHWQSCSPTSPTRSPSPSRTKNCFQRTERAARKQRLAGFINSNKGGIASLATVQLLIVSRDMEIKPRESLTRQGISSTGNKDLYTTKGTFISRILLIRKQWMHKQGHAQVTKKEDKVSANNR